MEEYKKDIVGIVFIEVNVADYDRVRDQLCKLMGSEDIPYSGILHPVHPTRTRDGGERDGTSLPAMFYLELEYGIWGNVVHWCDSAIRVGLIKRYRYAYTGAMKIVASKGEDNAHTAKQ